MSKSESSAQAVPENKRYKPFPAPGPHPFSPAATERRRRHEVLTYLAMASLYCRDKHEGPREVWLKKDGRPLRFFPGRTCRLCPDCMERARQTVRRTEHCRHMAYKSFCHNCPKPCHAEDAEAVRMMRYSGPRLLFRHPLIGLRFFVWLFRALHRNKRPAAPAPAEGRTSSASSR